MGETGTRVLLREVIFAMPRLVCALNGAGYMPSIQRLFLCRAGFLLFCLLPTLATGAWIVCFRPVVYSAAQTGQWEKQLSRELGMRVELGRITLQPGGVLRVEDVKISEPESRAVIATARIIELALTEEGYVVLASYPQVRTSQFAAVWELAHGRLLRKQFIFDRPVHILGQRLTVIDDQSRTKRAETFTDFECHLRQEPQQTSLHLEFRRDAIDFNQRASFHAVRRRSTGRTRGMTTRWTLDTHATPLPCWLVAKQAPALTPLGPDCEFRGKVWGEHTPAGWQGEVGGEFHTVDLERLVTYRFPHRLSGLADVTLSGPARFRDGRLIEAGGVVRSDGGAIGRGLLEAAAESLPLTVTRETPKNAAYSQLAVGFHIDKSGVRLSGLCTPRDSHALVADNAGPLLIEAKQESSPVVALVRALVPLNDVQVPATQETEPLLLALPIPSVAPPRRRTAPSSVLRLEE